jgi:hypothetical protein
MPESLSAKADVPAAVKTILLAGFVAGTLDILAAFLVYAVVLAKTTPVKILQSIASGVFGKQAFEGGINTAAYGLVFHYIIATCWALAYFLIYPYVSFLRNQKIIAGLLYGVFVWLIMNLVVLPLSRVSPAAFRWDGVLIGVVILMLCVGLPISLITHRYYASRTIN